MQSHHTIHRESLRTTLTRTITIAAVVALALSVFTHAPLRNFPVLTLLALWPSLGGHYVELLFLNHLRPHLPPSRLIHVLTRLLTWFLGGTALAIGMHVTALALHRRPPHLPWYLPGLAFIAIELFVHLILHLRRRPNFYNGRS